MIDKTTKKTMIIFKSKFGVQSFMYSLNSPLYVISFDIIK